MNTLLYYEACDQILELFYRFTTRKAKVVAIMTGHCEVVYCLFLMSYSS